MISNVLTPDSKQVLRALLQRPVLSGDELAFKTRLDFDILDSAIRPLIDAGYVAASSTWTQPAEIGRAYFNLNPSARRYAEMAAR